MPFLFLPDCSGKDFQCYIEQEWWEWAPVLFLILEKSFNLSQLSIILVVGLSYMAFIMLRYNSYNLLRIFIKNKCWICHILFLHLLRYEFLVFFFFCSVSVVYYINWFTCFEPSLHPSYKSYLIMIILLLCYWLWSASILLRIFASLFTRDIDW